MNKNNKNEKIKLIESSILTLYKKLTDKEEVEIEEQEKVLDRFYKLVNYNPEKD
ncbi:MAG: hypothetical protein J6T94_07650 [Bacteroidaceae bacterium]|nr:hypothetical protein [Bacteroidaceae bacterium]